MLFYVKNCHGTALVEASSEEDAEQYILREYGNQAAPTEVREASEDDESWVRAMGGRVHQTRSARVRQ